MKTQFIFIILIGCLFLTACTSKQFPTLDSYQVLEQSKVLQRIAFGSCASEKNPQPILFQVAAQNPDVFIYLGDNIYGDTENMEVLRRKYAKLGRKGEFQMLQQTCPILAIWDDHDYGANDAGKYYPKKADSKQVFLEFWGEAQASSRWQHEGIYHAHLVGTGDQIVQIILLDTRTFRSDLQRIQDKEKYKHDYQPHENPDSTILGITQWKWLEEQLRQPAQLRIIATSIQFGHEYNGYESWTNVPLEQQKMIDLIQSTQANGVVFISGDVHWAELSKREIPNAYPLYDATASGINKSWGSTEPNQYRVGEVVRDHNFGMIEIDWEAKPVQVQFRLFDEKGERLIHGVSLEELQF